MKNKLKPNKLNTPLSIIQAVLLLLMIVFCFSACEKDFAQEPIDKSQATILPDDQKETPIVTNREDIPKAEVSDLQIADNVKILDDNMIALLVDFNDEKVVFKKDEQIKFETDDIINSMPSAIAPVGIAHRIVKVEVNDENYTYYLKPANFDDMVLGGSIQYLNETESYTQEVAKPNKRVVNEINFETALEYNGLEAKVKVAGKTVFVFEYDSRVNIDPLDDYMKCGLFVELYDNPNEPEFTLQLSKKAKTPSLDLSLPYVYFSVGALFMYFDNTLQFNVELEANINVNLTAGFDLTGKAGYEMIRDGLTFNSYPTNTLSGNWVNLSQINNAGSVSAALKAPNVNLVSKLYGQDLFQFFVEVSPTWGLNFSSYDEYLLTLFYQTQISGGIKGEFRSWNYDYRTPIANSTKVEIGKYFPNPSNNMEDSWSTTGLNKPNRLTYMQSVVNNLYLSDEQGGTYSHVNRSAIGDWEKFQLYYHSSDKTYSIKGSNGRFFRVESGLLKCDDINGIGDATRFYIQDKGAGTYTVQSKSTGKYLTVETNIAVLSLSDKNAWAAKWIIAEHDVAPGGGTGDFGNTSGLKIKDIFNLNGSRNLVLQSSDNSWAGNAGLNFKYLHSENGNNWATVYSPQIQDQNKFAIEYLGGDSYAIKGSNGGYADIARSDGGLIKFTHWNREDSDCRFIIYYHGIKHNKHAFSIKSEATGKYLKSNHLGQVSFSADTASGNDWLIFQQ